MFAIQEGVVTLFHQAKTTQVRIRHLRYGNRKRVGMPVIPLECQIFMRNIKSCCYFEQLKSRGIDANSLKSVTNKEDNEQGRQVWFRCSDRVNRSERHCFATLNYIHNNPVKHGYVDKWGDWAYSSYRCYLENKRRDWLVELRQEYPDLNYGDQWDAL